MPEIPAPERVLRALAPVWPSLYTALEWATQQTRAYFDAEGTPSTGTSRRVLCATRPNARWPIWAMTPRRVVLQKWAAI
jgi:hypothetical protein